MDVQLQELIDKIKKDGVAEAENSAQKIVSEAEKKAAEIISEAEKTAADLKKTAEVEINRREHASEDAIKQSARNILISFRGSIENELSAIIKTETEKAYSPDLLIKLIPETVKEWIAKEDVSELSVILSKQDLDALEKSLQTALKNEISKGMILKADDSISAGFRIGVKNGSAFFDYTDEAIAELFSEYLNPRTAAILKGAVDKGEN